MDPFVPRTVRQIADQAAAVVRARSPLTDLSPSSEPYIILDAVARDLSGLEFRAWSFRQAFDILNPDISEEDFWLRAQELPGKSFERKGKSAAAGAVLTVMRGDASTAQTLPSGMVVGRKDGSATYRTVSDLVFDIGVTSLLEVYVECLSPGADGNCPSGVLTRTLSAPDWVLGVYNPEPLTNGREAESLAAAQARVAKYLSALGGSQKAAMEYLAESFVSSNQVQALRAKGVYNPLTPKLARLLVDDGSTAAPTADVATMTGTVPRGAQTVIAHPGPATAPLGSLTVTRAGTGVVDILTEDAGQMVSVYEQGYLYIPSGMPWSLQEGDTWMLPAFEVRVGFLAELQTYVNGDVNNAISVPGWQALGCRVVCCPPDVQWVDADIHVIPVSGVNLEDAQTLVLSAVGSFMQTLGPGEPLYVSQLVSAVCQISGILDVKFFERNSSPLLALQDRYPKETQVLRTSTDHLHFIAATGT